MKLLMMKRLLLISLIMIFLGCTKSLGTVRDCFTNKAQDSFKVTHTSANDWTNKGVVVHNDYRKRHGSPPLTLNSDLCKSAQWTANELAKIKTMVHTSKMGKTDASSCGENLYQSMSTNPSEPVPSSKEVVAAWYDEVKDYDFKTTQPKKKSDAVGHFTQVVWAATTEVCMAYARSDDSNRALWFVVAHYYPPGNVRLQGNLQKYFLENVKGGSGIIQSNVWMMLGLALAMVSQFKF